jgi:putative FmdB family regulatory protein
MPEYDYACSRCGMFTENHPLAEFALPQPCPTCGEAAPRAMSVPALSGAAAEPSSGTWSTATAHPGGCACCRPPPRRLSAEAV